MAAAPTQHRIACVDVPALPLQLVLRAHPDWRDDPVVLVEDDRPQAKILWTNRAARTAGILRGQRCQEAKALAARLHAAVLPDTELERAGTELLRLLLGYSPSVEPARAEPGLFFVDAGGLFELFSGLEAWAHALHGALTQRGFVAAVIVGFARFPAFAIARTRTGWLLTQSPEHEQRLAAKAPITALGISPKLAAALGDLGIRTLGDFLRLPSGQLGRRFGNEAQELLRRATAGSAPVAPVLPADPVRFAHDYELACADLERLLATLHDGLLHALPALAARGEALAALCVVLQLEHAPARHERLATAAPTLDPDQVLELVRLRLARHALAGPVERFAAELEGVAVERRQLELLAVAPRRDLAAGARALARLKAAFGDAAVTRARLIAAHLPEHGFAWEPVAALRLPATGPTGAGARAPAAAAPPLVRTFAPLPEPLGTVPVHEPEAWLGDYGAVQRAHGPFRQSHGWWHERVERDYFFVETDRGAILWVFHDRRTRRWYLHGRVD